MINKQWMRAGIGACGVASLVLGAGLVFAPAADAATPSGRTMMSSGVVDGAVAAVGGIANGVVTPNPAATSPVTVGTGAGGITVGVGSTTVGVGTTSGSVGVGVTGTAGSGIGVVLGTSAGATTATGTVTNPTGTPTTPVDTTVPTDVPTTTPTGTTPTGTPAQGTPIMLTALSATAAYQTVYPAKDGYRDTVAFQLKGTVSDGQQHAANGTATLTFGSSTVATWPITATDGVITWNGLNGGRIVPGRYVFTAVIGDSTGAVVSGTTSVDVSAKKLASATQTLTSKAITGTHSMAAKPRAGLAKGKVTVRIISSVTGVKGKQYLVFAHGAKKIKVLIKNGKHTSKAVTVPKAFTTFTLSHTWKKGVEVKSLKYRYTYKALK